LEMQRAIAANGMPVEQAVVAKAGTNAQEKASAESRSPATEELPTPEPPSEHRPMGDERVDQRRDVSLGGEDIEARLITRPDDEPNNITSLDVKSRRDRSHEDR
jgi:hypothetical protein